MANDDLYEEIRQNRLDMLETQRDLRELALEYKQMLDDPTIDLGIRAAAERSLLGVMEDLKEAEEAVKNSDAMMAEVRRQEDHDRKVGFGAAMTGLVVVLLVVIAIAA